LADPHTDQGGFVPDCGPYQFGEAAKQEKFMRHIDLKYRPNSYFWAAEKGIQLSSDIKGAERKAIYERLVSDGKTDQIEDWITSPTLSADDRAHLGRIHPAFMGGEYLPSRSPQEVEIARITIASTTQDVTCVYAKPGKDRIYYRVVDEYGGSTLSSKNQRTSKRPLTLQQLTDFFLQSWDLITCLDFNFEHHGYPRDEVMRFIVDASSSFYADFGSLVRRRVDDWLDTKEVG
jgi:hypothetical protein